MDENKRKHLEFIQTTICRMSSNLFFLKGWTITLIVALFALSAKKGNSEFVFAGYLMVFVFWVLDGYFLSKERLFRDLFNKVRLLKDSEIDFSMDTREFQVLQKNTLIGAMTSLTLRWFYGSLILVILIVPNLSKFKKLLSCF